MLHLHVLGTIMVDAGSRAASVTIQRVMDTEHGLGNVTGDKMLNTLLSHWMKYLCLEKKQIPSNKQQYVWLEELLTVSQFQKSSMSAPLLTTTCSDIEDSLRGSCCWGKHRETSRFVQILILLSAVLKLWTRLQSSVSVQRKGRAKRTSKRSCRFENAARNFIKPETLEALGNKRMVLVLEMWQTQRV